MKPCWKHYGLTEEGAALAENALPLMIAAIQHACLPAIAAIVYKEALFREIELPERSKKFRQKYLRDNK